MTGTPIKALFERVSPSIDGHSCWLARELEAGAKGIVEVWVEIGARQIT